MYLNSQYANEFLVYDQTTGSFVISSAGGVQQDAIGYSSFLTQQNGVPTFVVYLFRQANLTYLLYDTTSNTFETKTGDYLGRSGILGFSPDGAYLYVLDCKQLISLSFLSFVMNYEGYHQTFSHLLLMSDGINSYVDTIYQVSTQNSSTVNAISVAVSCNPLATIYF